MNKAQISSEESSQAAPDETRQQQVWHDPRDTLREQFTDTQIDPLAASPRSTSGSPLLSEEEQEGQPDLVTLRTEYATLSKHLEQFDAHRQAGQWARLYKQVRAAEARLRQAKQDTPPSHTMAPEYAKQAGVHSSDAETSPSSAESATTDERQAQLRAIASGLLYWKAG